MYNLVNFNLPKILEKNQIDNSMHKCIKSCSAFARHDTIKVAKNILFA